VGNPNRFELRFGNTTDWFHVISKVETDPADPAALKLYLSGVPEVNGQLICGPGLNPHMNITDSKNMPVPAFGPIEINFTALKNKKLIIE